MKRNNHILRIGMLALVLTLVTASLVSGTFAKYVTTVDGTGTVTVAKWAIKLDDVTPAVGEVNFDLVNEMAANGDVLSGKVAPGTKGSFAFYYDTKGTEVAHKIDVKITKNGTWPAQIKFFKNAADQAANTNPIAFDSNVADLDTVTMNTIANASDSYGKAGNVTLYWSWDFENTTGDASDTSLGKQPSTFTLTGAFTATQIETTGNDYNPS